MRSPCSPLVDRMSGWFQKLAGIRPDITLGGTSRTETVGIGRVPDWPVITDGLVARGFSDGDVRNILGLNFLRYWNSIVD